MPTSSTCSRPRTTRRRAPSPRASDGMSTSGGRVSLAPSVAAPATRLDPRRVARPPRPATRRRRTPLTWAQGGGLSALLFLLPTLLVFGAFSWYPIVRTVIMAFQHTNLVQPARWVGWDNFRTVWDDPLFAVAVKNTLYFAGLALLFG